MVVVVEEEEEEEEEQKKPKKKAQRVDQAKTTHKTFRKQITPFVCFMNPFNFICLIIIIIIIIEFRPLSFSLLLAQQLNSSMRSVRIIVF